MATITLRYEIDFDDCPALAPAELENKVSAAAIIRGELDFLGYTLVSDVTAQVAGAVRRTITLATNATSDAQFPTTALQRASVEGLYKSALNKLIPGPVSETITIV